LGSLLPGVLAGRDSSGTRPTLRLVAGRVNFPVAPGGGADASQLLSRP